MKGRPSGFDYLRLSLAIAIVCIHSNSLSYGSLADAETFWTTPARPLFRILLPMFFAVSGFLIAASLERTRTIGSFLGLRIIRIYPPLIAEMLIVAFIIGPLITSLTVHEYFTDTRFVGGLMTLFGDMQLKLPGVFERNPVPYTINGQLWMLPFELLCYLSLAGLSLFDVMHRRIVLPITAVALTLGFVMMRLRVYHGSFPPANVFSGYLLIVCFLVTASIYVYRDLIPWNRSAAIVCAVLTVLLLGPIDYGEYVAALPIGYVTVYFGLTNPRRIRLLEKMDLSYGIFIYGFVIQQMFASLGPWAHHWYLNIAVSLPITMAVAALSWHFIEKPALSLRKQLMQVEAWYLSWLQRGRGTLRTVEAEHRAVTAFRLAGGGAEARVSHQPRG